MKYKKLAKILPPIIVVLLAISFTASLASAGTGIVIQGRGVYEDGTLAAFGSVRIINQNSFVEWNQSTTPQVALGLSNTRYTLPLDFTGDINNDVVLRIIATNGSSTNDSLYIYTGGVLGQKFNITFPTPVIGSPDLIVQSVTTNSPNSAGYNFGNESNDINATIKNNGTANAGAFNVSFAAGSFSGQVRVPAGLIAGASTTVVVTDPTIRNAGDSVTIDVTADSNSEVTEENEGNNTKSIIQTVVNNGYKGKRYTGGSDITSWKTFDLKGNLIYSVGDSYYLSNAAKPNWTTYNASWTVNDLNVNGDVIEARLYVPYTYEKNSQTTYLSMAFNGIPQTLEKHYKDQKLFGTSYPYGMLVYNVTNDFSTSGNMANLTSSYPYGGNNSMRGMVLVVVYQNDSQPLRKIIINEEFDMLYGGPLQSTTPEEATAYAPFGTTDTSTYSVGRLITMAPGAGGPSEGELILNAQTWTNVWNFAGSTQIGIDDRTVGSYLQSSNNLVGFQSSLDYMEASNAILVLETEPPTVTINQASGQVDPTIASTINFTVVFSKPVSDFADEDVTLGGTALPTTATVTGNGTTYNVAVTGMTTTGTVIASIASGVAHDDAGSDNLPSTSTDNSVTYLKGNKIDLGGSYDTEVGRHIMVPITANQFTQFYGTVNMEFSYPEDNFNFVAIYGNLQSTVIAYNNLSGKLNISALNTGGVKGDVVLATVELEVVDGTGAKTLSLAVNQLQDIYGYPINHFIENATVHIYNPAGELKVISATSNPQSSLKVLNAILNTNGRPRHTGDNETVIRAQVTGADLGIHSVTVDLSAIGGSPAALMSETSPNSGDYTVTTIATTGVNLDHNFDVTATDNGGNTANLTTTNILTVYRRGDVARNNIVDMGDALYIARYTVGQQTINNMNEFNFVGDLMPASDTDPYKVNMGDALYIARHSVGLEPAP